VLLLLIGGIDKNADEIASGSMTYIPSFMTIGSGIQVILKALPQHHDRE
jgi:hypothetical protein